MIRLQGKWGISGSLYPKSMGPEFSVAYTSGPILSSDSASKLGRSLAGYGTQLVVGTEQLNSSQGGAYIYQLVGNVWTQKLAIYGAPTNSTAAQLGRGVATYGDWVAVGVPKLDKSGLNAAGGVQLYKNTNGTWELAQTINYPQNDSNADFGYTVDLSGDTLVVGSPFSDFSGNVDRGQVFVYRYNGSTWLLEATLNAGANAVLNSQFGRALSLDGDKLVVGAPVDGNGAAYAFTRTGTTWSSGTKIIPSLSTTSMAYGFSMKVRGNRLVVGSPGGTVETNTTARVEGGRVYYYTWDGSAWQESTILRVATTATYNLTDTQYNNAARLGWSVDLHPTKNVIISGAIKAGGTTLTTSIGRVYVFELNAGNWGVSAMSPSRLSATSPATSDYYGFGVSFLDSSNGIITSAPGKNGFYYYK